MSEGEKTQFKGNLALLRVCAIVFMVNVLGFVINMFFMAGQTGTLSSLWNAITTSSFEDCIGMIGMMIASGVFFSGVAECFGHCFSFRAGDICTCQKECDCFENSGGFYDYLDRRDSSHY